MNPDIALHLKLDLFRELVREQRILIEEAEKKIARAEADVYQFISDMRRERAER